MLSFCEGYDHTNLDKYIRDDRFNMDYVLSSLTAKLGVGAMPKSNKELTHRVGGGTAKVDPNTNQMSRWAGRINRLGIIDKSTVRNVRDFGRSLVGKVVSASASALVVFEGFYDWGVIGVGAWD